MRIGVVALQGDVTEHRAALERLGAETRPVRTPAQLAGVEGVVLPGGESTTLSLLLRSSGLEQALLGAFREGLPVLATCAGLILLARDVLDGRPDQVRFGLLDAQVRRNGFGRQVHSFEVDLPVVGLGDRPVRAVFIRAPLVEAVGPDVAVLARLPRGPGGRGEGSPVLLQQAGVLAASFHPELSGDDRIHERFLRQVAEGTTSGQRLAG
ncbi:pyridoxal 5'-phosphate synthase glutaminase subunit PdxT [Aciditerrimonas ferrireducens]|uniref:Pyridoxal 5'-phosphate synthase subunit PdxT n=1 Tax=Aciditerrimonas ferrireducens TaxID=667306 RepID=A0ABV6C2R0_9ACTN